AGVPAGDGGRSPRPDVVVTHDAPAVDAELLGPPPHRGEQLLGGGLAGQEDTGGALATLVERRVYVRHPAGHPGGDRLAHRRDVPAGDGRDRPGGHQGVDLVGDPPWAGTAVDHHEPDLAPEHAALAVDLLGGELGTGLAGRAEDPGRALQGDHQGDVEVVVTHSHSLSA